MATPATAPYNTQAAYIASVEEQVQQDILSAYEKFQAGETVFSRDYGIVYGKVLYIARQKLNDAGYGQLSRLLDKCSIPRSTAYAWMEKYEISIGVKTAKPKVKVEPTVEVGPVEPVEPVRESPRNISCICPKCGNRFESRSQLRKHGEIEHQIRGTEIATFLGQGNARESSRDATISQENPFELTALFSGLDIQVKPISADMQGTSGNFHVVIRNRTAAEVRSLAELLKNRVSDV